MFFAFNSLQITFLIAHSARLRIDHQTLLDVTTGKRNEQRINNKRAALTICTLQLMENLNTSRIWPIYVCSFVTRLLTRDVK